MSEFMEILAAWFLVLVLIGSVGGVWTVFTRSPQEISMLMDKMKSTVKSQSSKAVLYGRALVQNSSHSTPASSDELILSHSLKA